MKLFTSKILLSLLLISPLIDAYRPFGYHYLTASIFLLIAGILYLTLQYPKLIIYYPSISIYLVFITISLITLPHLNSSYVAFVFKVSYALVTSLCILHVSQNNRNCQLDSPFRVFSAVLLVLAFAAVPWYHFNISSITQNPIPFSDLLPSVQLSQTSINHKVSLINSGRLWFPFGTAPVLGVISLTVAVITFLLFRRSGRYIDLLISFSLLVVSVTTFSRSSLLPIVYFMALLVIRWILLAFLDSRKLSLRKKTFFITITVSILASSLVIFLFSHSLDIVVGKLLGLFDILNSSSSISKNDFGHWYIRAATLDLIGNSSLFHIVFGHGAGGLFDKLDSHAHCTILTGAYEFGLFYVLLMFCLLNRMLRNANLKDYNIYIYPLIVSALLFYDFTYETYFYIILFSLGLAPLRTPSVRHYQSYL